MFQMHAADRNPLDVAEAGDIVACVGVKEALTGDTLSDQDHPVILERPTFPEPANSLSIEPKTAGDKQKLGEALTVLKREDPTFQAKYDDETGQTIIAGMGELHLEILRMKLTRDHHVDVLVGKPKVAYKETLSFMAEARGKHVKQTGGRGQFGDCTLRVEPYTEAQAKEEELKWVDNVAFENKIFGGSVPKEYIPSIEYGARQAAKTGVLANYPLINAKITLLDGSYHAVDSSQIAFELAGQIAFKEACRRAGLQLLEPIMKLVVTTPEEFVGNVNGDINRRRGLMSHSLPFLIVFFVASVLHAADLPAEIKNDLTANAKALSPLSIKWKQEIRPLIAEPKAAESFKLPNPLPPEYLTPRQCEFTFSGSKMRTSVETPRWGLREQSFDGDILYIGNHDNR